MQHTANEVIETIRTLPIQEKAKVYEWLDEEKRESVQKNQKRELKFRIWNKLSKKKIGAVGNGND